jgi:hypothetical protein
MSSKEPEALVDRLQALLYRTRLVREEFRASVGWAHATQAESQVLRERNRRLRRKGRWFLRRRGPLPRVVASRPGGLGG